jgi:hypothetical protein
MRSISLCAVAFAATLLSACEAFETLSILPRDPTQPQDGGCPKAPDLATPLAPCAAAQGLPGTVLRCNDMSKESITSLKSQGWLNFQDGTGAECWEVAAGVLQIKSFGTFQDTCSFRMPPLNINDAAYAGYASFTVSLLQRVHMDEGQQRAQILLGSNDPATRLLLHVSGRLPRMRSVFTVTRDDLANMTAAAGNFQLLFNAYSGIMVSYKGWQIESIAILGNPQ